MAEPRERRDRSSSWRRAAALVLVSSLLVAPAFVPAAAAARQTASARVQETPEEQSRRAAEIYKTVMSPFCPGRTVDACPSPYAAEWRDDIRRWVGEGASTEEIRRRLKERTDKDLSGAPSTALDSVLPIVATVMSLALLGLLLRVLVRPTKTGTAKTGSTKATTSKKATEKELDERLERELEQLDS